MSDAPRPRGLGVIAFFLALLGAGMLPANAVAAGRLLDEGAAGGALATLLLAFPVAMLAAAAGLFLRRAWGATLALAVAVVAAVSLALVIAATPFGGAWLPPLLTLVALLSVVLYVRRPHVRAALR